MCQVTLIGVTVVMLYASRACYNLVVLSLSDLDNINSFDYDWYNVSDQVRRTCPSSSLSGPCDLDLDLCRRTCAPRWETAGTWCSGSSSSSGSCCPPHWLSSSSGCDDLHRKGSVLLTRSCDPNALMFSTRLLISDRQYWPKSQKLRTIKLYFYMKADIWL